MRVNVHECQTVNQDGPEVFDVGIFARINVLVDEYGIMNDVVFYYSRCGLHAGQLDRAKN